MCRRKAFVFEKRSKELLFLTTSVERSAATICALDTNRWQVELFFEWLKQP